MEIIDTIVKIMPDLLKIALMSICLYFSYQLIFNLYASIREYITIKKFTNKKRLFLDAFIILGVVVLDWHFLEIKLAWLGCLFALFVFIVAILSVKIPMVIYWKIKIKQILKSSKEIKTVTKLGFEIEFGEKTTSYQWKDIETISLKINKKQLRDITLSIKFHNRIKLSLDKSYGDFYFLLKNIPKDYYSIDYGSLEKQFENLRTCPFCGLIAFENFSWCLHCGCGVGNGSSKELHISETEIREEQLEIFATMGKNEKFSDFKKNNNAFARDENWKPLITKQEVLQYSKENYWE